MNAGVDGDPGVACALVPPAAVIDALFGERAGLASRFVEHLATSAVERGLVGPREVPRLWDRHVLNCAVIGTLIPRSALVVDVGSGAGLPGLALGIARPDLEIVLVEPLRRRVTWLEEVVTDLGLDRVEIVRARAEELVGTVAADVATARAVAALPVLAGWCLPLVKEGGRLLALKGLSAGAELADSKDALRGLGAVSWEIQTLGAELLEVPTTVVVVQAGPTRKRVADGSVTSRKGARRRDRGRLR